jgi:hypothetical protein
MSNDNQAWTKEEFEAQLRGMESHYHIHHPYHTLMNEGKLTKAQLQGWVANRFYYQVCIPIKDANILANCPDRETRAKWIQRIMDHDELVEILKGKEVVTRSCVSGVCIRDTWIGRGLSPSGGRPCWLKPFCGGRPGVTSGTLSWSVSGTTRIP